MSRRLYTAQLNNSNQNSQRWRCAKCGKILSSKRSFDEHMNVHSGKRPFDCNQCKYSSASQMTLRRHKLRNHIPRNMWGYQCPHCSESYMEPASYQQHVASRHAGFSATFGCTYCRFDTKSSKHFRKHMLKHMNIVARHSNSDEIDACNLNIAEYLIDDDNGRGHCLSNKEPQIIHQKPTFSTSTTTTIQSNTQFLECGPDFFKAPLELKTNSKSNNRLTSKPSTRSTNINRVNSTKPSSNYIIVRKQDEFDEYLVELDDNVPEIQNEIIIDESETYKLPQQKQQDVVEFGLD